MHCAACRHGYADTPHSPARRGPGGADLADGRERRVQADVAVGADGDDRVAAGRERAERDLEHRRAVDGRLELRRAELAQVPEAHRAVDGPRREHTPVRVHARDHRPRRVTAVTSTAASTKKGAWAHADGRGGAGLADVPEADGAVGAAADEGAGGARTRVERADPALVPRDGREQRAALDVALVVSGAVSGADERGAVARALMSEPEVLLCDEPTRALDPDTARSVLSLMKRLNEDLRLTVVIICHQMSVIEEICTRVAILDGGEVAEEGRVEDIFAHPATDAARRLVYPGGVSAKQYPTGTRAVRVSFNGGTVYDPLIASLAIECGVKVNILGADTRNIDGKAFGTMLLLLPDDPNEAAKALSYIRSQPNITAEEVEYHA